MVQTRGVKTEVNTGAHKHTYITTTVMQVVQRILHKRGLNPGYFQAKREVIEKGVLTWITDEKLKSLLLQVLRPGSSSAMENWRVLFEYKVDGNSPLRKPPVQQVEEFCVQLRNLPPGCEYQIFAEVAPDATYVEGWVPGTPLPIIGRTRKDFVRWGHDRVDASLEYEGCDFV